MGHAARRIPAREGLLRIDLRVEQPTGLGGHPDPRNPPAPGRMKSRPDAAAIRVARAAQDLYGIDAAPVGRRGDAGLADGPTARAVAARMNAARPPGSPPLPARGPGAPSPPPE